MKNIDTLFIDLGDTFRVIRKDEAYQREAMAVIANCLGVEGDPEEFYHNVIEPRYDKYREWALHFYCEAPVDVLWTRWLAYDFPKERVLEHAAEMTYAYRKTKGERVVTDGGIETVKELYKRGYTLAIVSDLVGTEEVDEWLDKDQLRPYFKSVQQSSVCLIRKPHP
ncbi:MAG: HAD hydrolase-like protein, partial [Firmicutes bacterium]|nr:HAD hydrolase-like protein [Bacillota bacterium]